MILLHNYISKKKLLKVSKLMLQQYSDKMKGMPIDKHCPVCDLYRKKQTEVPNCTHCFNTPPKIPYSILIRCLAFKTNNKDLRYNGYRHMFWEKVIWYVYSINTRFVKVSTVRKKLDEIDKSII